MPHKHKYFLACDHRAYYVFEVSATSFEAARRKVALMIDRGLRGSRSIPANGASELKKKPGPTRRRAQRIATRPRQQFVDTRLSIERHSRYWAEGFISATSRKPVSACPYPESSKRGRHWLGGYAAAGEAV